MQTVVDSITKAIIAGELKPGDKIPTELELAESFGVGRNSIREAIKILVYYGILEIRRAEGTFVCNGFNKIMIDPMVYGVILHQSQDYVNLMELREMMEVGVMRLAIAKYNEEDIEKLRKKLEILRRQYFSRYSIGNGAQSDRRQDQQCSQGNDLQDALSFNAEHARIRKRRRAL